MSTPLSAILALGFFLGMRHATDADHIVAVSTIVAQKRSLRAAAPIGVLWGLGHTLTVFLVGGAMVVFHVAIPARVGLALEMAVAVMLVVLGASGAWNGWRALPGAEGSSHGPRSVGGWRPLFVGMVHGLAGSAAAALLVLGAVRDPAWALAYLAIFGAGTLSGMALITVALAAPAVLAVGRFERAHRLLAITTGIASVGLGVALAYDIGAVQGLFSAEPRWHPR